jgi:hypothetical protein
MQKWNILKFKSNNTFFGFHHQFNVVRGSVLASSGFSPSRSQLSGINPWSSLPSSTSIITEPNNDWYNTLKSYLRIMVIRHQYQAFIYPAKPWHKTGLIQCNKQYNELFNCHRISCLISHWLYFRLFTKSKKLQVVK